MYIGIYCMCIAQLSVYESYADNVYYGISVLLLKLAKNDNLRC